MFPEGKQTYNELFAPPKYTSCYVCRKPGGQTVDVPLANKMTKVPLCPMCLETTSNFIEQMMLVANRGARNHKEF